jgi:hypothetical protein
MAIETKEKVTLVRFVSATGSTVYWVRPASVMYICESSSRTTMIVLGTGEEHEIDIEGAADEVAKRLMGQEL